MHVMTLNEFGINVAYFDLPGDQPDRALIVMLHGLGASAQSTFGHVASLTPLHPYRRILIDLPGFGSSKAPKDWSATIDEHAEVIAAFLDRLNLSSVSLIGHSMGGSIAIALTSLRPDLVGRLIVAEPNLDANTGQFSGQIARFSEAEFLGTGRDTILRAIRLEANRGDSTTAVFAKSVADASPEVLYRSAVSLRAVRHPSFRQQLAAIDLPRLYIAGETSKEIVASELTRIDVEFAEIRDSGHVMMADDPNEFVRIVCQFLDSSRN